MINMMVVRPGWEKAIENLGNRSCAVGQEFVGGECLGHNSGLAPDRGITTRSGEHWAWHWGLLLLRFLVGLGLPVAQRAGSRQIHCLGCEGNLEHKESSVWEERVGRKKSLENDLLNLWIRQANNIFKMLWSKPKYWARGCGGKQENGIGESAWGEAGAFAGWRRSWQIAFLLKWGETKPPPPPK